jgi:hypothetical protein
MYKLSKFIVSLLRFAKPEMLIADYEWAEACHSVSKMVSLSGNWLSPPAFTFPVLSIQPRAMISLRETKQNSDLMHCPTAKSGNHPFRSAARVVQRQLQEYLENRPWRGFAHVGVELGVPIQSAGHMRPNASVAVPRFQRNRCDFFGLNFGR